MKKILAIILIASLTTCVFATVDHVTELQHVYFKSYFKYYDTYYQVDGYGMESYFYYVGRYDDFDGEPTWINTKYRAYISQKYPDASGTYPDYGIMDSVLFRIKLDNIYTTNYSDTVIIRDAQDYYVGGMYVSDEEMWNSIDDGERYCSIIFNPYTSSGWISKYFYPGDSLFNAIKDSIENDSYFELGFNTNVEDIDNRRLRIDDIELKIYWHEDPQMEVTVENRYNTSNLGGYLSVEGVGSDIASGTTLDLCVDSTYRTETQSQRFASPAVQHHHWNEDESEYRLSADLIARRNENFYAEFLDYDDITLASSISAAVYIKDPWYVNPYTGEQDNPYQTVTDYEVFLNQNDNYNPDKPSYCIKASAYTGGSGSYNVFRHWSTIGNTTFQSSTSPETKVCFKDTNRVTAEYWTGISVTDGTLGHDAGGYYVSYSGDRIYATTSGIYEVIGWESSDNNKAQIGSGDETKCYVTFRGSNVTLYPEIEQVNNQTNYIITVNSDETLSIPAGANISFASGFTLGIEGTLSCEGSTSNQIQFSGQGKDESTPFMYNYLNPTSDTLIKVINSNAEVIIKNTSFSDLPCGLRLKHLNQNVNVTNVKFIDNNVGISIDEISDSDYILDSLYFEGNDIGVAIDPEFPDISQESAISIAHSIFYDQGDCGIFLIPTGWGTTDASQLDLNIFNCTFWDINKALYIKKPDEFNGTVRTYVTNCIFGGATQSIIDDAGPEYWLFEDNNISDSEICGLVDEIITDPQVIDPDNQDFRLKYSSPCIDAGRDIFNEHFVIDYDPDGTNIDIGALYYPQNSYSGTIDSDTTWYGRITVTGDVTVDNGVELTIDPGSMVMFNSGKEINVYGTLTADGTPNAHIVFTRSDTNSASKSYWDHININSSASYTFDNIEMYGATYGIRIYDNNGGTVQNSLFKQNYRAFYLYDADNTNIKGCDMINNNYGIYCSNSNILWIEDNLVDSSYYYGIYMYRSDGEITDNVIRNTVNYDGIRAYYLSGPDLSTCYDPDHIRINNTIANNNRYGVSASSSSDTDLGSYLFIGTDYLGGFNYFNRGSGLYDVYNYNSGTIKAECNWWSSMYNSGSVDASPTASSLGFSLPKASGGTSPSAAEQLLAKAYYQEKVDSAYAKAITTLNQIAETAPGDDIAWKVILRLARLYRKSGDINGLKKNLDALYTQYSNQLIGKIALDYSVSVYSGERNFQEALNRLTNVISLWSEDPLAQEEIACALFEQGMIYMEMDSVSGLGKESAVAAQNSFNELFEQYPESEAAWLALEFFGLEKSIDPGDTTLPEVFALRQNYPNPFNPMTTIEYDLPEDAKVTLIVYDVTGREVIRLVDSSKPAGFYKAIWDGRNSRGQLVSSGVYICRIQAGSFTKTSKMVFIR